MEARASEGVSGHAANKMKSEVSQNWEDELREARVEQLRKLIDFGALKAVEREEARGNNCVPCKWVDQRKEGVVKSRSTVADVKSKNPDKEQQDTFSVINLA